MCRCVDVPDARGLFLDALKPPIVFADLARLDKRSGAFLIEATEVVLNIGYVGLEIPPDQICVGPDVLLRLGKKRSLGGNAGSSRTGRSHAQDQQRQGYIARTVYVQGKTPLPPLRLSICRVSLLSKQGDLRQVVIIVLLTFMLSCIAHGVSNPWNRYCTSGRKGPKGRP